MRRGAAVLAVLALGCGACTPSPSAAPSSSRSSSVPLISRTAEQIVRGLQLQGLDVDHPVDVTVSRCAAAGCAQAVVTDRFRLLVFPTTGAAQTFAVKQHMRQIETLAVGFAPVVPPAERDRYWTSIVELAR